MDLPLRLRSPCPSFYRRLYRMSLQALNAFHVVIDVKRPNVEECRQF